MAKLSEHVNVINDFHDVNSNLCTVASIHHKVSFFLKVGNVFPIVNLTLW